IEDSLVATPPHLHYWLDEDISAYHRHMEYARRLTYLALRAFEYESQQSIGLRSTTLTVPRPDDLLGVVTEIEARNAPMQGELGFVVGPHTMVLSLRDEILQILDIAHSSHRLPGQAVLSSAEAFQAFLASDSSKILDANGNLIGRGIRFSLQPGPW